MALDFKIMRVWLVVAFFRSLSKYFFFRSIFSRSYLFICFYFRVWRAMPVRYYLYNFKFQCQKRIVEIEREMILNYFVWNRISDFVFCICRFNVAHEWGVNLFIWFLSSSIASEMRFGWNCKVVDNGLKICVIKENRIFKRKMTILFHRPLFHSQPFSNVRKYSENHCISSNTCERAFVCISKQKKIQNFWA